MRRLGVVFAVLASASVAQAQPLTISGVIDPVTPGRATRTDWPIMRSAGEGFAIDGVGAFDGALQPTAPVVAPPFLASCLPGAIGTTTCLVRDPTWHVFAVGRMSLADGTMLDTTPLGVAQSLTGGALIAASGDDFLLVALSGELYLWRSGAASSDAVLVPTACPLCTIQALACTPGRCSALVATSPGGPSSLFRVDVGATPALGASTIVGVSSSRLVAFDDQWMVGLGASYAFFDDALVSLGTATPPRGWFECFHDACLAIDAQGALLRCRSGACTPFGSLPPMLVNEAMLITCGTVSCGVAASTARSWTPVRIGGFSSLDGSSVDLSDAYWSRPSSQDDPHVAFTSDGPLVAYTDDRGDATHAAVAPIAPGLQSSPILAELGAAAGLATSTAAFVPSARGATLLRRDTAMGTATSWLRIAPSGTAIDVRDDAFTCFGVVAAGPRGIVMACMDGAATTPTVTLLRVTDDGRPIGPSIPLPIGRVACIASGETRDLAIDESGHGVLIDAVSDQLTTIELARGCSSVAAGAGRFVVASGSSDGTIDATILGESADTPPITLTVASSAVGVGGVVFDGSTFLVTWSRAAIVGTTEIVVRRVRADGVVEPDTHVLATLPSTTGASYGEMNAASNGVGMTVVPFVDAERGADGLSFGTTLHAVEIRSLAPIGTACVDASACGSAVCENGVCCAMPCPGPCRACDARGFCANTCLDAGVSDASIAVHGARDANVASDVAYPTTTYTSRTCRCGVGRAESSIAPWVMVALVVIARARRAQRMTARTARSNASRARS
jgi:hypothetical protein